MKRASTQDALFLWEEYNGGEAKKRLKMIQGTLTVTDISELS